MKALIYSLAWRILPYVCCLPAGAAVGFLLVQVWRAAK